MLSGVVGEQGIVDLGVPRSSRGSGTSKIKGLSDFHYLGSFS